MNPPGRFASGSERGSAAVEFAMVCLALVALLLGVVEIGRLVLVYNGVAQAARAGARYAIVHGVDATTASGPSNNPSSVITIVKNYASTAPLDTSRLSADCSPGTSSTGSICVTYPNSSNAPGNTVRVTVRYLYDPLTSYFPLSVHLASTSSGVITF